LNWPHICYEQTISKWEHGKKFNIKSIGWFIFHPDACESSISMIPKLKIITKHWTLIFIIDSPRASAATVLTLANGTLPPDWFIGFQGNCFVVDRPSTWSCIMNYNFQSLLLLRKITSCSMYWWPFTINRKNVKKLYHNVLMPANNDIMKKTKDSSHHCILTFNKNVYFSKHHLFD